jgi:hypothetical protein
VRGGIDVLRQALETDATPVEVHMAAHRVPCDARLYQKSGVPNRDEAATYVLRHGPVEWGVATGWRAWARLGPLTP